jgi:outer membrane receptor protein involved in Fe transport
MPTRGTHGLSAKRRALGAASVAVLSLGFGGMAFAQAAGPAPAPAATPAAPATVQEVVVTGSRIAKKDFTSNSPIVTVNSQSFENTSNVAVDATLNKLPQFVAAQDLQGLNAGDIQPTAINTPGIATASLRGLGSNRNLVLVDGRRLTPVNGLNVIDLNTIPSAMIDHVETITGGASAVYGADAMSGVVNFILKKNFQGLDLDGQYSISQHGDDREFKISGLFGANFADDKGNVTFGLEHYTRSPTYENKRDFFKKGWADPTTGTNALFQFAGAQYVPNSSTGGCATGAAYTSVFGAAPGNQQVVGDSDGLCALGGALAAPVYFNTDGSLWTPGSGGPFNYGAWAAGDYKGTVDGEAVANQTVINSGPWFYDTIFGVPNPPAPQTMTSLKENTLQNYVLSPMSRWSVFGSAHYDLSNDLSVFVQGNFASTETRTRQLPSTLINGWGALIPYNQATDDPSSPTYDPSAGHPVPAALASLLNARQGPFGPLGTSAANTPWQLNFVPDPNSSWLPPRTTTNINDNWQLTAGLDGKLPFNDWTWEAYGSHGQTLLYTQSNGNVSLERYRTLVNAPNWGKGFDQLGNQGPVVGGGFGAGHATCTSGLYNSIFFNQAPTQDCLNALEINLQSSSIVGQDVVEFDSQGGLFELPAGELKASVGADYRSDSLKFTPDAQQSEFNFLDQVAGLYPAAAVDAAVDVKEGYGELSIPVLADMPFVRRFELNPGVRYSSYSNTKAGWTYKLLGDWSVNDWLRLRGGYNLAVRAPTVAESYLGLQEVFGVGSAYGDPCSTNTNAPYGANGTSNPNAASAQAICRAQMGATGAGVYYAAPPPSNITLPFGWQNQIGNPNLNSEKAHTWTAGVVIRSPIESPWLDRTSLSVDWYKIKITGAIGFENPDVVNQACYSQVVTDSSGNVDPTALAAALASEPCQRSTRNTANGTANLTTIEYRNLGKIETSGFDVQLNWGADFADLGASAIPGSLQVSVLFNYLSHMTTNSGQPNAYDIDWAGTLGPAAGLGLNGGAFRYKLSTTVTYNVGPASVSVNWRHLPGAHASSYINASATTTQNPAGYLSATNETADVKAYNVFDLSGTYNLNRTYSLRAGVDNLFNTDPAITGATFTLPYSAASGIFPSVAGSGLGSTDESIYDSIGRRFYVGVRARF